jgi:hypothetical protein
MWTQVYDPFHSPFLSALVAFLPAALLLVTLAGLLVWGLSGPAKVLFP